MPRHRVLVVDDYEPFRRFACSILERKADLQVVGEVSDGLEAVQKAEELRPDLILLDIGLPNLNGIEVARRLGKLAPDTKILFLSQESSSYVVEEALRSDALGYVHKSRAQNELLPAIEAVLGGGQFVSGGLEDYKPSENANTQTSHLHEVQFYSDDGVFLDSFSRFITAALKSGNAAIVAVTKSHQDGLLQRLREESVDVDGAIQRGTYIWLDAAETLSGIMVNGLPDRIRFFEGIRGLIDGASKAAKAEHPRVALCGERVGLLWAEGNTDAAIRLEQLCNDLAKKHDVDILCAYPLSGVLSSQDENAFKSICAEHSAVHSR
jgi:DNA-binding NarL/FixJ family response regulator